MNSWEDWYKELLSLAVSVKIQSIIKKCESMYKEYYESGKTPEEAYFEEWG